MKKLFMAVSISLCFLSFPINAAWKHSPDVTIKSIIEWQDNTPVYFKLSNDVYCWIPAEEKNVYSLILMLYTTQKKINIHCHEAEVNYGGIRGHRFHRIITN